MYRTSMMHDTQIHDYAIGHTEVKLLTADSELDWPEAPRAASRARMARSAQGAQRR